MKFTCSQKALLDQLEKLVTVTEEKGIEPDYAYVWFDIDKEKGRIIGKDDHVVVSLDLDVKQFRIERPGHIRIHADTFYNLLTKFEEAEELTIETDLSKPMIKISSATSESGFMGREFGEIPALDLHSIIAKATVSASNLSRACWQTEFAASFSVSYRTHIQGVEIKYDGGKIQLNATDEHQIAHTIIHPAKSSGSKSATAVVSRVSLIRLGKLINKGDIAITYTPNIISFSSKEMIFNSRLLESSYPDLSKVVNIKWETPVRVPTNVLKKALDIVLQISDDLKWVTLSVKKGSLEIHSGRRGFGQSKYVIKTAEEKHTNPLNFTCNGIYLTEIVKRINTNKLIVSFDSDLHKCLIQPEDDTETKYLLTAMNVPKEEQNAENDAKPEAVIK